MERRSFNVSGQSEDRFQQQQQLDFLEQLFYSRGLTPNESNNRYNMFDNQNTNNYNLANENFNNRSGNQLLQFQQSSGTSSFNYRGNRESPDNRSSRMSSNHSYDRDRELDRRTRNSINARLSTNSLNMDRNRSQRSRLLARDDHRQDRDRGRRNNNQKETDQRAKPKIRSIGARQKRDYKYAEYILSKIKRNEKAGIVDERDVKQKKIHLDTVAKYKALQSKATTRTTDASRQETRRVSSLNSSSSSRARAKPKKRSDEVRLRRDFRYAQFMLNKVKLNEEAGIVDPRDVAYKDKYLAIIAKYEAQQSKASTETNDSSRRESNERVRSLNGGSSSRNDVAKKSKPDISSTFQKPKTSEVVRDHLQLVIVDELAPNKLVTDELWIKIESRLSELIIEHILAATGEPLLSFDSSEMVRGYRVIKCENDLSLNFLKRTVCMIGSEWDGSKIELIPVNYITGRPKARIWLPKMEVDGEKLMKYLQLQNPQIPMNDWSVIKKELPQENSQSFLLMINEDSIKPLVENDNKLKFGIREAQLQVFSADTNIDAVDESSGMIDKMISLESVMSSTLMDKPKTVEPTATSAQIPLTATIDKPEQSNEDVSLGSVMDSSTASDSTSILTNGATATIVKLEPEQSKDEISLGSVMNSTIVDT